MDRSLIRNFSIIAHIDHGKSTLADRILEFTGAIDKREFRDQILDSMDLERERGITIKASCVRLQYKAKDGNTYLLNLIDTPGHVDFTYEVSKSIGACEGALLLVDAAQGVEAQTVANLYLAIEHNLVIVPVINKIDLPNAEIGKTKKEIVDILGASEDEIIEASAKLGQGTEAILEKIVQKIPPPSGNESNPLQALIFDSAFDIYKGVIIYVRIVNGKIEHGMNVRMMATKKEYEVHEVGVFKPKGEAIKSLAAGEVGYITCNIKDAKDVMLGDTVTDTTRPAEGPLPGYKKIRPLVFSGIYPENSKDFPDLREAVEKLRLSDASFIYEPESSASLGFGFRCGFLGLLHMEIIQERLEREYNLNLILTTPSVVYKVLKKDGTILEIDNPTKLPDPSEIELMEEPFVKAFILTPHYAISPIMELCKTKRGKYIRTEYLESDKISVVWELPLSEIIVDFYDKIKSLTKGYGSLDYEFLEYIPTDVVRLDILVNGEPIDAFSTLVYREKAHMKGKAIAAVLKDTIPKHLFKIAIQAAIGGTIIAREDIGALKKHVTAKCYGGDITRKRKLWEKQKEGKKRMKQFGNVNIPQEAFIAALKA
ncbi:MAG: elongation factor 4 [Candidatus Omnitrophica bacterium CG07_land_8_20_14_0_80_42_15]|uniref:Elongation factor 4 n=1 Tax=Candidatus Aquitaenariimonas noxiae TaxID=1974741 RepID=A0A2J0KUZ2_9BACT|nr:MAG: elongation factor 4 [Candidatus Omnitrophica bacterium CG07_land_8_20_14_0_80_42_15]